MANVSISINIADVSISGIIVIIANVSIARSICCESSDDTNFESDLY